MRQDDWGIPQNRYKRQPLALSAIGLTATANRGVRYLPLCLAGIIILGIWLRFSNLEEKIYWVDEAINMRYTAGYTETELANQVRAWDGQPISVDQLQAYQRLDSTKNAADVVRALAIEEPQSPPLYYLALRKWIQIWGDSIAIRRSLSVLLSLFAFHSIFWLCRELFSSATVGWLAMALLATSPFHLLYAQEVRYYSAWASLVVLSCAVFLWALRTQTPAAWISYTVTLAIGLYTCPLTGLTAISHGLYLFLLKPFRLTKQLYHYLLAAASSIVLFSPWLVYLFQNSHKISDWRQLDVPLLGLIKTWIVCLEILFWDFHQQDLWNFTVIQPNWLDYIIKVLLLFWLGGALIFLIKHAQKRTQLFIMTLVILPWAVLAAPDIFSGGIRSTIPRYLIPSYLGIHLTVAFWLSAQLRPSPIAGRWARAGGRAILVLVLSIGLLSCFVTSRSEIWWNKGKSIENPEVAQLINQINQPLVISWLTETSGNNIFALSYLLSPDVRLQLMADESAALTIPGEFERVFLFEPSDKLLNQLKNQSSFELAAAYQGRHLSLWEIR